MTTQASQIPGYVTAAQAAERIGISRVQVTRYIKSGLLDAVRVGPMLLIRESKLRRFKRRPRGNPNWIAKRKRPA